MSEAGDEIAALAAGFYRKRLWAVVTTPVAGRQSTDADIARHLRHQVSLEKQGLLFAAGPLSDEAGTMTGAGLIILRADSAAAARAILDADPMHAAGLRTYTLQQWQVNEGRIGVSIDLSDSRFRLD